MYSPDAYALDFGVLKSFFKKESSSKLQFKSDMRYSDSKISYKVLNCPNKKTQDIKQAFEILSNRTILSFVAVEEKEEISVSCNPNIYTNAPDNNEGKIHLGSGGPNYLATKNFNVIVNGEVVLERNLSCSEPIVELHEILHALGYDHSSNPDYIMYPKARCGQIMPPEIIKSINELYSTPGLPDLSIEEASLNKGSDGKYIIELKIANLGLVKSSKAVLIVHDVDKEKVLTKSELGSFDIGDKQGARYIIPFEINNLRLEIKADFDELEKENNIMKLVKN